LALQSLVAVVTLQALPVVVVVVLLMELLT